MVVAGPTNHFRANRPSRAGSGSVRQFRGLAGTSSGIPAVLAPMLSNSAEVPFEFSADKMSFPKEPFLENRASEFGNQQSTVRVPKLPTLLRETAIVS